MSSPIGQEAAFGVYQNSGRFNVKFSTFGDCSFVIDASISLLECVHADLVRDAPIGRFCFSSNIFITTQLMQI